MESRTERIVLETPRHEIVGNLSLPSTGYRSRLSDFLNHAELGYIPLTDVELRDWNTGESVRRGFVAVARTHIQVAYPHDGAAPG